MNGARGASVPRWRPGRSEAAIVARLALELPSHLRHPITLDQARATLEARRARRTADFLALVRGCVDGAPASPYRALLERAACAYPETSSRAAAPWAGRGCHSPRRRGVRPVAAA